MSSPTAAGATAGGVRGIAAWGKRRYNLPIIAPQQTTFDSGWFHATDAKTHGASRGRPRVCIFREGRPGGGQPPCLLRATCVTTTELVDAAAYVKRLLLAGVERM